MSIALSMLIRIIREIVEEINNGNEIIQEHRPRELRTVWTNINTTKEYSVKANQLRKIIDSDKNDPRIIPALNFVLGHLTAEQAKNEIEKLENLKAFW